MPNTHTHTHTHTHRSRPALAFLIALITITSATSLIPANTAQAQTLTPVFPNMTSATAPPPYQVSASSQFNTTFAAWHAFNSSPSSRWTTEAFLPQHIQIGNPQRSHTITHYTLRVREDAISGLEAHSPSNWTLAGSNDGTNWTILDTQSNIGWTYLGQSRTFRLMRPATFNHFRLTVTATTSGNPSSIVALTRLIFLYDPDFLALYAEQDLSLTANINPSISLTLDTNYLNLGELIPTGEIRTGDATASVSTNHRNGFNLYLSAPSSTNMTSTTNPNDFIPTIPTFAQLNADSSQSAWGWRRQSDQENHFHPTTPTDTQVATSNAPTPHHSTTIIFGAWASGAQPAGEYRTQVRFTATGNL